jgi:hypothetical protein
MASHTLSRKNGLDAIGKWAVALDIAAPEELGI